jgi:hypothetical protein
LFRTIENNIVATAPTASATVVEKAAQMFEYVTNNLKFKTTPNVLAVHRTLILEVKSTKRHTLAHQTPPRTDIEVQKPVVPVDVQAYAPVVQPCKIRRPESF